MAHPYHHALSSVKKWGGDVSDYLPLHAWFDQSKAIAGDFRCLIRESLDLTGDFNAQVNELHLSRGDPQARRNLPELQRAS
jgi:hypothetical protein